MGVIVISLGAPWSAGEYFGCTWECRWTNVGITNKLWEMPGFVWIFIRRTAGVIWDSSDVHEQSTSLNSEYDAWIIVHYHFWIILLVIFFNVVFCASLHQGNERKRRDSNINTGTPKQYPNLAIEKYQSNMVSMSSTPSPIPSGLTKAGTHNSSTAETSWRRSMYLLIIRS